MIWATPGCEPLLKGHTKLHPGEGAKVHSLHSGHYLLKGRVNTCELVSDVVAQPYLRCSWPFSNNEPQLNHCPTCSRVLELRIQKNPKVSDIVLHTSKLYAQPPGSTAIPLDYSRAAENSLSCSARARSVKQSSSAGFAVQHN